MSILSGNLASYATSKAVADWCAANNLPLSSLFCRLQIDRPPFFSNAMRQWAEDNPQVTAQDFADMDTFFSKRPAIRDFIVSAIRKHAPHIFCDPLLTWDDISRPDMFSRPLFQSGILKAILPLDDTYRLCSTIDLQKIILNYRDVYPWAADNDCNKKANRISGFFASLQTPRPVCGEAEITGLKAGTPFGHFLNFAICTDGEYWIENDGTLYPLADSYGDISEIVVQAGFY